MAFTYDLSASKTISRVRMFIGDSVENSGPRPDSRNFSDAEITDALELEGDHRMRACAFLLETLANEWSAYAGTLVTGPKEETQKQADAFAFRAKTLRGQFGYNMDDDETANGFSVEAKVNDIS